MGTSPYFEAREAASRLSFGIQLSAKLKVESFKIISLGRVLKLFSSSLWIARFSFLEIKGSVVDANPEFTKDFYFGFHLSAMIDLARPGQARPGQARPARAI